MTSGQDIRGAVIRHAPLALCAAVLVWHALQYSFVTDDAYISFVYSRNLAERGELVFNPGDRVEGYTNFLWTLLLGLLMLAKLPPEITSLVLGAGFAVGTLVVVTRLMAWIAATPSGWDALPALLLAMSSGYACWTSGGLETQMFTFWVALGLYSYVRGDEEPRWLRRAGVFLALAAMTRPEGLLVTAVVGLHRLGLNLARERRLRPSGDELLCIGGFLLLWAPWFAWRWWYYGYPLPNTYYVKAGEPPSPEYSAALWKNGAYYMWVWLRQTGLLLGAPLALAGLLWARPRSRRMLFGTLAAAVAAIYAVYTMRVGGDFMGLHRFIMPLFVLAAVAVALGLRLVVTRLVQALPAAGRGRAVAAVASVAVLAGLFGASQLALTRESLRWGNWASDNGIDTPAYLHVYTRDRAVIGKHMRDCFEPDDFSIVGGAGAKPYHARMRGIDVFGLVSARIAHEVPPTNPRAGHNKWAPDALLAEHEPDFVFSCYSIHQHPAQPRFNCNPRFWLSRGYRQVTLHIPGLRQQGEYYSFLVRADRDFACEGLVE